MKVLSPIVFLKYLKALMALIFVIMISTIKYSSSYNLEKIIFKASDSLTLSAQVDPTCEMGKWKVQLL